jgi:hypothetical protein
MILDFWSNSSQKSKIIVGATATAFRFVGLTTLAL